MAGTYTIGEKKTRPGVYHRYENTGGLQTAGATNGIGAAVVRASWGPLNKVIEFEPATSVEAVFGTAGTTDLITAMFTGGLVSGFFVRAGHGGKEPSLVINTAEGEAAGTIKGAYVGARAFTATIRDNLAGDAREFFIYDGTRTFLKVTFAKGDDEVAALKEALEAATNDFILVLEEGASGALADIAQAAFTGGEDPEVTAQDYSDAFNSLEPYTYNVICIDTTAAAVKATLAAYLARIYEAGSYPMAVIAADTTKDLETRMEEAVTYNDPKVIFVLNGAVDSAGTVLEDYLVAARIGGEVASTPANQSVTHLVLSGYADLAQPLTNTQVINALKKGCLVLTKNKAGQVHIEQGINTLITPNAEQDDGWKKIRRVKTRFELMQRIDDTLENVIGKVNNDTDGRATIVAAGNSVIKTMAAEQKLQKTGGSMAEDDDNPPEGDSAWFVIAVDDIDSIEKVYLLYRFRFTAPTE
jgi:hypothetical protein